MTVTLHKYDDVVKAGIDLLDSDGPGRVREWRQIVEEGVAMNYPLHMEDNCGCILGHVHGTFWRAVESIPELKSARVTDGVLTLGVEYGFNLPGNHDDLPYYEWHALGQTWIRLAGLNI